MSHTEFFLALATIIVIDVSLAGANAIVIRLASGNLPAKLQRQALVWGALIAIFVRVKLTLISVQLLAEPYLMLAGGVVLLWAGYRFLTQQSGDATGGAGATTLLATMQVIIVADVVIGLDNVLAVAGAARGHPLLVPLGLMISIPLVIWGAEPILKLIAHFPSAIYVGGATIAWTAAKMVVDEPFVNAWLDEAQVPEWPIHVTFIAGTLWAAWLVNRREPAGPPLP